MSMLQVQIALLEENITRMKLAGSLYANPTPPLSSAEVCAVVALQHGRRSA
jgi:hypothetical protein